MEVSIDDRYTPEYASYKGWPAGCYVARVIPNGAAAKAGIKAGDIITAINGVEISHSLELTHQLFKYKPGDTVDVTYFRAGETHTVKVKLGEIRSDQ